MADRKISDLTALTAPAAGDYLPIVDISEVAAASKNKRITIEELFRGTPDGTAAAPAIAPESDPNTGIYSSGADQLSIATNGTERLRIDSAGQIEAVSLGTAAAPTFSFTGDPNTGIYSPGADQVAISTNGTGRLFVDASGRVLAGVNSSVSTGNAIGAVQINNAGPSALTVSRWSANAFNPIIALGKSRGASVGVYSSLLSGDVLGEIQFAGDDGTDVQTIGASITAITTGNAASNSLPTALTFGTTAVSSPTERLRITSAGLVGIGTSSPTNALLHVSSPISAGAIKSEDTGSTGSFLRILGDALSGNLINWKTGTNLRFATSDDNYGSFTERARIDSTGRLGLGSSAPQGLLHVEGVTGNAPVRIVGSSGNSSALALYNNAATTNRFVVGQGFSSGSDNVAFIQNDANAAMVFGTNATERLRITAGGAVGIGTTSPLFPLDVNGVIYTRGRGSTFGVLFDDWRIYNSTAPGALVFDNGSERARIDSSGRLLVGTSTSVENVGGNLQVNGGSATINTFVANSAAYRLYFVKSRSGTFNGKAIVQSGDDLGRISFNGDDGVDYSSEAASIACQVDGTPGADDMPGRLVFSTTADGAASPTERLRITSAGQVRLAGAGITFNGDTAAANELDDYEEGTFTPTVVGSTTAGTATYSTQTGIYTKVGRKVTVVVYLNWSGGTGTGNLQVSGLPFTALGSAGYYYSVDFGLVDNIALTAANVITGYVSQNTTTVVFGQTPSGGGAYSVVPYDAAGHFMFSCTYFA